MGIIDKVKTIFWDPDDEDDDEEEVKVVQPKRRPPEEKTETVNERDAFKTDNSFKFPVVFTEEDFAKTIPPEKIAEESPRVTREVTVEEKKEQPKEEQKGFRLSPAISPIYGVLDKNYKKEDIKSKSPTSRSENDDISFENVRKKAYGTLSDDIENTLTSNDIRKKIEEKEKKKKTSVKIEEEINPKKNITIEEAMESYNEEGLVYSKDNNTEEDIIKLKKDKRSILEDTIEQDLFNLIDSMYDKEEKEDKGEDK